MSRCCLGAVFGAVLPGVAKNCLSDILSVFACWRVGVACLGCRTLSRVPVLYRGLVIVYLIDDGIIDELTASLRAIY